MRALAVRVGPRPTPPAALLAPCSCLCLPLPGTPAPVRRLRAPPRTPPRSPPRRRVLTMEWIEGVKLTTLPPDELRVLTKVGQDAFLTQLLEVGFCHVSLSPGRGRTQRVLAEHASPRVRAHAPAHTDRGLLSLLLLVAGRPAPRQPAQGARTRQGGSACAPPPQSTARMTQPPRPPCTARALVPPLPRCSTAPTLPPTPTPLRSLRAPTPASWPSWTWAWWRRSRPSTARPWCRPPSTWPTATGPRWWTTSSRSASCPRTATGGGPRVRTGVCTCVQGVDRCVCRVWAGAAQRH